MPTPIDKAIIIDFLLTLPSVISSTCLFNTKTAGSARTTTKPIIKPIKTTTQFGALSAKLSPSLYPIGTKPTSTAVKNITKPTKVYKTPIAIFNSFCFGSFNMVNCNTKKNQIIIPSAIETDFAVCKSVDKKLSKKFVVTL